MMTPKVDQAHAVRPVKGNRAGFWRRSLAIVLLIAIAAALCHYPIARLALAVGLCVFGAILYIYPAAWLIVIPTILPVLDLTPWSGRFFFEELDLFILLTLAVGLWRGGHAPAQSHEVPARLPVILLLLAASYAASLVIGLLPLQPLDANALSNYQSHYNSLRMAKGFLVAVALFFLLRYSATGDSRDADRLVTGMVLGLTGVVLAVLWERFRFSGLFDFTSDFRVVATFSGLHNGGADPEAYLALAQPFLFAWAMRRQKLSVWAAAGALFAGSTYAMLVTYSRAGYLGLAVSWAVLFCWVLFQRTSGKFFRAAIAALLFLVIAAAVALPVFKGSYIQSRFATLTEDLGYRLTQSINSVRAMNDDWRTRLFGMGLGTYPETFRLRRPLPITPSSYMFGREGDNTFLRLFPGSPLFFEQIIATDPHQQYSLTLKVRGSRRAALVAVICEKNLLYSFACAEPVRLNVESDGHWRHHTAAFNTGTMGTGRSGWLSSRPVKFTLRAAGPDAVDVDDVRLVDSSGRDIVANGDFSEGIDRWFFATDEHLAWQIKNHWVHLYFEQGWLGLTAHLLFSAFVVATLISRVARGNGLAGVMLASIAGFFVVGLFGFLFDTPRIAMLYFFLALSTLYVRSSSSGS